ncbi:MAG: ABC transporter substrate-binding protein [Chloroflexota bacterium]|nr:ABC transporter substrate-binding protein [Chloroflexota bacterium]
MAEGKTVRLTRRQLIKGAGAAAGLVAASPLLSACGPFARPGASGGPLRIGILLPYSDIYAVLGESITEGMRLYFDEVGNEAGGRQIEVITEDTEIQPDVAQQKARKLVEQDEVDLVAGIVSSGVLMGLRDYFDSMRKLLIVANAGANPISRDQRSPYIWRTSFTNWQPNWPVGAWAAENVGTRAFISVPDYAAGEDTITSFSDSFMEAGGEVIAVQRTPFPNMGDPAPFMAEIANAEPDLVYSFYSGSAAVTFVQAYGDFGLAGNIPLMSSGFMVEEDVLPAQGEHAMGIRSGMHWSFVLDNPENDAFKTAYRERTGEDANVFAVQGYDTAHLIVDMINAVEGDTTNVDGMIEVIPGITFDSPRGPFVMDENSHNPSQHIYLREVQEVDGELHNAIIEDLGVITDPGDNSRDEYPEIR